nr:retinitis pigmentosa 1-like 1 protein [Aedes albopictus]
MMERFAINILHKRIYKICRLCGVDQPHKIPIIDGAETIIVGDEDEEASLAKKIEECVGIQVHKDDKMPQNICALCVDKINDFYEYRLMCAATNLQTRSILNLNLVEPSRKLLNFGEVKEDVKKEDVKKVVEVATSSSTTTIIPPAGKKGKKKRGPPSPSPSPCPTTRIKAPVDVKDEPVPAVPVKALTKKERLKQLQLQKEKDEKKKKEEEKKKKEDEKKDKKDEKLKKEKVEPKAPEPNEQKHTRSKRKEPSPPKKAAEKVEQAVPPPKKIKFEHPCSYCSDEFKTQDELDGHLKSKHTPLIRKFGCSSCRETFDTILESKDHNLWHQLTRTPYTCHKCKRKHDKNLALVKHMGLNSCGRFARGRPPSLLPDVQCRLCNKKFKTQNLYEWHGCFIKPKSNCPKCGKYFVKKQILTRHYMMFCTGTLPPPEPVIIPKAEPVDPAEAPAPVPTVAERRKRRVAFAEPELPKEEREIPFPPPLEPEAPTAAAPTPTPAAPTGGKKKSKKDTTPTVTIKPVPPAQTEKITSLLTTGAKLDRDSDIATINNLLSSVTEAIASISEAKAKKKKKKKDKNKDKAETEADPPVPEPAPAVAPAPEPTPAPKEVPPETPKEPSPPEEEKTEEELEAYALAQEVGEMTLEQQLAFCSGKLPLVVLPKTTFKQEYTEIETEPSQMQEPMDDEQTVENGENDDDGYDDNAGNDYSGFQDDDDDGDDQEQQEAPRPDEEAQQSEELQFPMPIKQEVEPEEPSIAPETPQQEEAQSPPAEEPDAPHLEAPNTPVEAPKSPERQESLFDERLAINIKKEPGLEEDLQQPAAKRKRPESRGTAVSSPASSLSSSQSAPHASPKLILKINKGMLNSPSETAKQVRTIVLDDDDDEEEEHQHVPEPDVSKKTKVYKKPDFLAAKIKKEKVDPAYERHEPATVVAQTELPGGIRIKQERLDPDEEPPQEDYEPVPPPQKKSRLSQKEKPASPVVVAFDGVRIKQEKPDKQNLEKPTADSAVEDPKPPQEKKKKSKGKINPFALLRQKMAAEAAAKSAAQSAPPPQAPSPLPVITNVVGNAPTASTSSTSDSSGENTPMAESDTESERRVPVISQVASIAAAAASHKVSAPEFPIAIKQEPVDEPEEEEEQHEQQEQHAEAENEEEESAEDDFPMPIKQEAPEETPTEEDESPEEAEEPEESQQEESEAASKSQADEPVARIDVQRNEPESTSAASDSEQVGKDEKDGKEETTEEQEKEDEQDDDEEESGQESAINENECPSAVVEEQNKNDQNDDEEEDGDETEEDIKKPEPPVENEEPSKEVRKEDDEDDGEEEEEDEETSPIQEDRADPPVANAEQNLKDENEEDEDEGEEEEEVEETGEEKGDPPVTNEEPDSAVQNEEEEDDGEEEEEETSPTVEENAHPAVADEQNEKEQEEEGEEDDEEEEAGAETSVAVPETSEEPKSSVDEIRAVEKEIEGEDEASSSPAMKESLDSAPENNKEGGSEDQGDHKELEESEPASSEQKMETEIPEKQQDETKDSEITPQPQLSDEPDNCASPISDIPMDEYDQNSSEQKPSEDGASSQLQEPRNESTSIADVPKPSSTSEECPDNRLESQLEELQNLLTEGLKPLPDSSQLVPDSSSIQNMVQSSSMGSSSVGNNVGMAGLDDDLDSLLNNKLEEMSAAQPAQDDLNLAIERELLHEMMPIGGSESNSILGVGQNLLLDGNGNNGQQSS